MRFPGFYDVQPPQVDYRGRELKDRWGDPLQTRYLRGRDQDLEKIRKMMLNLCRLLRGMHDQAGSWALLQEHYWPGEKKLELIGNDPKRYTLQEIVQDMEQQLTATRGGYKPKDITQSFINRYNYIVCHMAIREQMNEVWLDQNIIDIQEPLEMGIKIKQLFEVSSA